MAMSCCRLVAVITHAGGAAQVVACWVSVKEKLRLQKKKKKDGLIVLSHFLTLLHSPVPHLQPFFLSTMPPNT